MSTLQSLAATIQDRKDHPRPGSYTATLFAKGERGLAWEDVEAELARRFA